MDHLVGEFILEAHENFEKLDSDLVALERNPGDAEALAGVFRVVHTLKATSGFCGFEVMESLAHVGEALLDRIRNGELELDADRTTVLLRMIDAFRELLGRVEADGTEGDADYSDLVSEIVALGGETESDEELLAALDAAMAERDAEIAAAAAAAEAAEAASEPPEPTAEPEPQTQDGAEEVAAVVGAVEAAAPAQGVEAAQTTEARSSIADSKIRVDVAVLDELMNLVGELVLARNEAMQYAGRSEDAGFVANARRINLITSELQERVMQTRMQPIGTVWDRLPRLVRDVSHTTSKSVRLDMEGRDTELDRTLIEAIADPLTHLVRNAVDHGIETPEVRAAAGKSDEGRLFLRAYHDAGHVCMEIGDDGAGLDLERIRAKAVERGLVDAERARILPERDVSRFIFHPGFSTAAKVTNISGRGVGMDVVKSEIERIGGVVDVTSKAGAGTTFTLKIPLTLAIVPALVVECGNRYAIPQASLQELVRLEGEEARSLETIHGAPVHRLRGELLPIVSLRDHLGLPQASAQETADFDDLDEVVENEMASGATGSDAEGDEDDTILNIVVLHAGKSQFGLVVDTICDTEEIVVKPLGTQLADLPMYSGATIMGDGKVALILDAAGLAQSANLTLADDVANLDLSDEDSEVTAEDLDALLLFRVGEGTRMALPMSNVARLEEFPVSSLEASGDQQVVQYRGDILPLISVAEALDCAPGRSSSAVASSEPAPGPDHEPVESELDDAVEDVLEETIKVVLYSQDGQSVGLVVDTIEDIVADAVDIVGATSRQGVLGSAIIRDSVTDLLDVTSVITHAYPRFFDQCSQTTEATR